jgi:tetratricopeptide (TPR) repeat protein
MTLVTSRDRLSGLVALDGARRVSVDPLPVDESVSLLASIIGAGRITAEPDAAAALVDVCGRLPLALRIAGATLVEESDFSLAAYTALLTATNRLSHLTIEDDPESSVRQAFSHSYLRLAADVQRMFRLLGLVPGGDIGVAAAAALAACGETDAAGLLDRLCSAHLLNEPNPGRYALHDLIRDYATEIGLVDEAPESREAAIDRVVRWYVTQADHADHAIRPPLPITRAWVDPQIEVPDYPDAHAAFRWFDLEGGNLLELIRYLESARPSACCSLVSGVFGWLDGRRRMSDWFEVQSIGIRAAVASGDRAEEALMRSGLANSLIGTGRFAEALVEFERSLAIRREVGAPPRVLSSALTNVGSVLIQLERSAEGLVYLEQALTIIEEHSLDNLAQVLNNIGCVYDDIGQPDKAIECFERSLELAAARGDDRRIISACGNLCSSYLDRGEYDRAITYGEAAVERAIAIGQKGFQARGHLALGLVEAARGRLDAARAYLDLALEGYGDNPDEQAVGMLREKIAEAASSD